jgi:hypothetical protein
MATGILTASRACGVADGRAGRGTSLTPPWQSDLLHYSNESINRQIAKIAPYADGFVAGRLKAGRDPGLIDLAFRPWWTFFRAYVLKAGFLDGWPGYYIAWMSGFSTATRYAKVREARLAVEKVER